SPHEMLAVDIPFVAREQLVATVSGKCNRYISTSKFRHEVCGDLRRVGEWLVEQVGKLRHDGERIGRGHRHFRMIRLEDRSDSCRVNGLVVLRSGKCNRECASRV